MTDFQLRDQDFTLLPDKAMLWQQRQSLLLADTHFGKITHFRKAGIPLPPKAALRNMQRFEALILRHQPQEVIILGDLFHSEMNTEWLLFKELLERYPAIDFHLVQGNHDIFHPLSYRHFQVHQDSWLIDGLLLSHAPIEDFEGPAYNLAGHLHPGVRMYGPGRQSMRFPCFYFGKHSGVLPAFGEFTGLHLLKPSKQDQVFVIADQRVIRAA